jgi:putative ABC transport system permease protein
VIRFLLKGLVRDRSRSLFPVITVMSGVSLTVLAYSWVMGVMGSMARNTAVHDTGHVRIMTRAYAAEASQVPNDLALTGADELVRAMRRDHPDMLWTARIRFGGLLDVPDAAGETKAQGPVAGLAVDLFSPESPEPRLLNLGRSVARGRMPAMPGEVLVSEDFASRLGVGVGDTVTLIGATMDGAMAAANFSIAGTVRFGIAALDRGAMIADLGDVRRALDMEDAAGEVLGFFADLEFRRKASEDVKARFNAGRADPGDPFAPEMFTLRDAPGFGSQVDYFEYFSSVLVLVFLVPMSLVLWNVGLMGGLRRYGEIGIRLAIGESRGRIYRSMLAESVMIGLAGSVLGTALGLAISYYLQVRGVSLGAMLQGSSIMIEETVRARVTPTSWVLGFVPGLAATLLGTGISGIDIFRRQTAQLAKELGS